MITITIRSNECGNNKKASFLVNVNNGETLSLDIVASFTGPRVSLLTPNINFGLNRTHSEAAMTFEIKNETPIPARVLFREAINPTTFFESTLKLLSYFRDFCSL